MNCLFLKLTFKYFQKVVACEPVKLDMEATVVVYLLLPRTL